MMPSYTDQIGKTLHLESPPNSIISLVPSQTELLWYLGLETEVIGITKFCIHPDHWFRTKTRIGGTKNPDLEKIYGLQPELIIANKEENVKEDIESLANHFPVWTSDVNTYGQAIEMILSLSHITGKNKEGEALVQEIDSNFEGLKNSIAYRKPALYLIWRDPYMAAGRNCFIHDMLQLAGFDNAILHPERYPEIRLKDFAHLQDLVVFLSSEPYPFREKHIQEIKQELPDAGVMLADGEMFSWYGSRMLQAASYFHQLRKDVLSLDHAAGTR